VSEPAITRNNSLLAARFRHPMHVRTGPSGRESSGDVEIFRRLATSGQLYLLSPLLSETGAPSLKGMSDLQCAATLLLVPSGLATDLGTALGRARVAHVWTGSAASSLAAAEAIAADLGVGVARRDDLDEPAGLDRCLAEIADEHRGETVVVVVAESGEAVVEVTVDGDGMARRPWAGSVG